MREIWRLENLSGHDKNPKLKELAWILSLDSALSE